MLLVLAVFCAAGPPAHAQEAAAPSLRAGVAPEDLRMDGVLNEPAWAAADFVESFRQTDPLEGAPATGSTTVHVLADARTLVIGVKCDDLDLAGIVSFSVRRDASLGSEDHIRVVLGPFLDGRSATSSR